MTDLNKIRFLAGCLRHMACTPNMGQAQESVYLSEVIEPYKAIQKRLTTLTKKQNEPDDEEIVQALHGLLKVFQIKQVPLQEQADRIEELLQATGTDYLLRGALAEFRNEFYSLK